MFSSRPQLVSLLNTLKKRNLYRKADKGSKKIPEKNGGSAKQSQWFKSITWKPVAAVFATFCGFMLAYLGSPIKDEDGLPIRDEFNDYFVVRAYIKRAFRELDYYLKILKGPPDEKLLPDPLPFPYSQPKYTLVLELTDVLVHADWKLRTGLRYKKRPLVDYFLDCIKKDYEIVIYTGQPGMTVFPLMEYLDTKNVVAFKLVWNMTKFSHGHHVKLLNNLNRDLSKVICIDWNPKNLKMNPDNLFCIKRWKGNDDDTSLLDLANFLKTVAENKVEDVREVLKVYRKYEDPVRQFREKQKRLIDEREMRAEEERKQEEREERGWRIYFESS